MTVSSSSAFFIAWPRSRLHLDAAHVGGRLLHRPFTIDELQLGTSGPEVDGLEATGLRRERGLHVCRERETGARAVHLAPGAHPAAQHVDELVGGMRVRRDRPAVVAL